MCLGLRSRWLGIVRVFFSNAYPELDGKPLEGKLVLEIPATNRNLADIEKYKQIAKEYGVVLRFMEE